MKKIIKRKLHISTYSRDFIDYINHEFYSHDKHNAFFEFTMEQLPTDNVVALFYFQKTKRYAEIHGVVEDNKVTIEFDTSLITTNETVCGYIYFEKVEQSADVCRFCFNVKVSEIDKLKNAPIVEKETRRLIPVSEIVTKAELQELFKTIEKNGGTYNDTEIRKSINSIEERVQTLENKPDNNTVYDDSDVINRLNAIESKPTINTSEFAKKTDIPQAYNDSELSRRVSALETKEDKDTVYNDEEIKRRLSNLEGKTDNFISGVSVNKEGNNVTLTYNYVDGQAKNVSFTDSDTINIAYDDSALKTRLNDLENRPQIDVSEFAKKSEIPQAYNDSELSRRVSALETKENKDTVYNDEEIKRRLSNLEGKTDNFISGVSVNKEGNNVTLTYNYVDGQTKNVSFTDSDTVNLAYDDSGLKARLTTLETNYVSKDELHEATELDETQIVSPEELEAKQYLTTPQAESLFAKKSEIPPAYNDSELNRRVSALETKEDKDTIYNDEEIKRRLSNLEGKTDNFISGVSVNKEGNNVTLTYNYVDGQTKNVSFTDSDTINIAYDDSALKSRLNDLENRPQIDVSEFAKKSELPTVDSVNKLLETQGEQSVKISTLESKAAYEIHGTGMPNGKVEAPIGTTYVDTAVTNGALKWIKQSGTGNTGWKVLIGDTGWRTLNSVSRAGNSFIKIRRVNNLVTYQFGGLQWGWFGVGRRGGPGFLRHNSSGDKGAKVIAPNGIPEGFRSENSIVGPTYDDKGRPYGIWYLGGKSDLNFIQFTFNENIPTDRDIGDIRVSAISYITDEDWPTRLP